MIPTYEAWRISFQDSEAAAREAYKTAVKMSLFSGYLYDELITSVATYPPYSDMLEKFNDNGVLK